MKKEKSCGIIVFDNDKVLLVKSVNGHFGFPKGHVEINETEYETAIREVKEETNCDAKIIDGFREKITYSPREGVKKDVIYFIGKPITKNLKPQESEIKETIFVLISEALNIITYDDEKGAFVKARNYYLGGNYDRN